MSVFSQVVVGQENLAALVKAFERRRFSSAPKVKEAVEGILERLSASDEDRINVISELGRQFDCPSMPTGWNPMVTEDALASATISADDEAALQGAIDRVRSYHQAQLLAMTSGWILHPEGWHWSHFGSGQRLSPVNRVGIYVPGGKASYPSSVIMNVIPALVAGVEQVVVASPAAPDGSLPPAVLVACRLLGITSVLKAGGAYAIGGLAFGVPGFFDGVDVIAGPGNAYVNEAKRAVWGAVGLDGFAGSSEVAVVIDATSDLELAVADLITQTEHSEDNSGMVVGIGAARREEFELVLARQLETLPRAATVRTALKAWGMYIEVEQESVAAAVINHFAPEHLAIHCAAPETFAKRIRNAGCLMIGPNSAQAFGDYCAGPSHTLPTSGAARFASPVGVQTFMKVSSTEAITAEEAAELAPIAARIARLEGFEGHARGAESRQKGI